MSSHSFSIDRDGTQPVCAAIPPAPISAAPEPAFGREEKTVKDAEQGMKVGQIELFDGNLFNPLDPDPALMTRENISAGLANSGRFGGQCALFYSVAQHSVLVAALTERDHDAQTWGLLHDAEEAFGLPDLPSPLKPFFPDVVAAQDRLSLAVAHAYGLDISTKKRIKPADRVALAMEKSVLKRGGASQYWISQDLPDGPEGMRLVPMEPEPSRLLFLDAWDIVFKKGEAISLDWMIEKGALENLR